MMRVTKREFDLSGLAVSAEQFTEREPGLHVSSIIHHMRQKLGKLKGEFSDDDLGAFALVGRLWERLLEDSYFKEPRYARPGSCNRDGIIGSPDCVDLDEWSLAEFKCTWVSSSHSIDSERLQHYLWQIKSYCYILGMARARTIVVHVCGNWRDSPVPVAWDYQLYFTKQELYENWMMLRNNAEAMNEDAK